MMNKIGDLKDKNILFLQGPMGPFFKHLDTLFRKEGATTYKIGFNFGDYFYSNKDNYIPFKESPSGWPEFIKDFLAAKKIDKIFLFGDCRYYQKITRKIAYENAIDVYVFEEGYVRPHYITMEKFGVNGFSTLPREANFYLNLEKSNSATPAHAKQSKYKMVKSAVLYYLLSNLFWYKYPQYLHHRDFSALKEFFYGIRDVWRKGLYKVAERDYEKLITHALSKKYYFVPLQTHNDFQILQHSHYGSIEKFIIEVLESFAHHAPKNHYIVFKHHPVDRGRKNYHDFIMEQAESLGVKERILVFHDVYLPTCLQHAIGTVTINSTVGLTAIGYGIPTLTLGNAVYDIEGLTNKGTSLHRFWYHHKAPDPDLYGKFRGYLIEHTQLNGSFYGLMPKEFTDQQNIV
jgi:capsular polysaccharide export protein